ncbi:hypothetical protein H7R52_06490 [Weissella confusa]|uniref:Uncharacterized protein n=1 Tax=Weissella confusa TaxID=1583 RepID=A0A923SSX6_WEICO|nr:hypothetical protein [Weissella confusa]
MTDGYQVTLKKADYKSFVGALKKTETAKTMKIKAETWKDITASIDDLENPKLTITMADKGHQVNTYVSAGFLGDVMKMDGATDIPELAKVLKNTWLETDNKSYSKVEPEAVKKDAQTMTKWFTDLDGKKFASHMLSMFKSDDNVYKFSVNSTDKTDMRVSGKVLQDAKKTANIALTADVTTDGQTATYDLKKNAKHIKMKIKDEDNS